MADLDTRLVSEEAIEPPDEPPAKTRRRSRGWRFFSITAAVIVGVLVYAYGFEKTDVDLSEIQSETRQTQLVRILRDLARPELFTYSTVETNLDTEFMSPCPGDGFAPFAPDASAPYITVTPTCVEPGGQVTVSGFQLEANRRGDIYYIADSGATIRLGNFLTDGNGEFSALVDTRERESEEPQVIRAVTAVTVGSVFNWERVPTGEIDPDTGEEIVVTSPRWSDTAIDTWDKIIETVFLALIATTVGTVLAIPLSFFAARNLMRDISVPLTALTVSIVTGLIGIVLGIVLAGWAQSVADRLIGNDAMVVAGIAVLAAAIWLALRWAIPTDEEDAPSRGLIAGRLAVMAGVSFTAVVLVFLVASLMATIGDWLSDRLGPFGFVGLFLTSLGDITRLLLVATAALATGLLFLFIGVRLGTALRGHLPSAVVRPLNIALSALAGALVSVLLAQAVAWLYEFTSPMTTIWWPALIGAILGAAGALIVGRKATVGTGLSIYYIARTVFNAIRAIEPLIMVIVFVVWVGLGPFAGALALALHTTAALAKLYSEQVESIALGPIEAIKATGATRLQTIVYGVVPQIVPPYISFTMYRWDINVRMSTIIGFAGGGGIGFLLQQNINLLDYRAAAVQMLAIAIVVASMDYLSSRLRERFV